MSWSHGWDAICSNLILKKTEFIIFASKKSPGYNMTPSLPWHLWDINISSYVRSLGVIFDSALSFAKHIDYIFKSCNFYIKNIGRIRQFLSKKACEMLVVALVTSRLDYCNSLLNGLSQTHILRLQRVETLPHVWSVVLRSLSTFRHLSSLFTGFPLCSGRVSNFYALYFELCMALAPFIFRRVDLSLPPHMLIAFWKKKPSPFHVMPKLCADVIVGQEFLKRHDSITFVMNGPEESLTINTPMTAEPKRLSVAAAKLEAPRLFEFLSPTPRPWLPSLDVIIKKIKRSSTSRKNSWHAWLPRFVPASETRPAKAAAVVRLTSAAYS